MPTIGPGLPGAVMEAFAEGFTCGLVGTIFITIDDSNGNNVVGPTTANIIELECTVDNFGVYRYLGTFPADTSLSPYLITWEGASGTDPAIITTGSEEILVSTEVPVVPSGGGLCTSWIDGDDVAECCSVETTSGVLFDDVAEQASSLLFQISGRLFSGQCGPKTVRPPCNSCSCGYQVLSRGHVIGPWDYGYPLAGMCDYCLVACEPSRIKLSGYPIREITQIKIDGDVIAPSEYTIYKNRYVTRLDNGRWPVRQNLTLEDTEEGTFSISYTYGADPPNLGVQAAAQLACELYKECSGDTCALPKGTTRVTRQGITIDRLAFTSWAFQNGVWRTGLPLVDAFLQTVNPAGLIRRPTFYAPGSRTSYAQPFG